MAPNMDAFIDVPQPVSIMCLMRAMRSLLRSRPPRKMRSSDKRPPKPSARAIASGCSKHSRSVQCGYGAGVKRSCAREGIKHRVAPNSRAAGRTSRSGASCTRDAAIDELANVAPSAFTTPISPSCRAEEDAESDEARAPQYAGSLRRGLRSATRQHRPASR